MSELGDDFRAMRDHGKAKKARNQVRSAEVLHEQGIRYEERNGGVHLIVLDDNGPTADFWPGTGLWALRVDGAPPVYKRGVFNLIKALRARAKA